MVFNSRGGCQMPSRKQTLHILIKIVQFHFISPSYVYGFFIYYFVRAYVHELRRFTVLKISLNMADLFHLFYILNGFKPLFVRPKINGLNKMCILSLWRYLHIVYAYFLSFIMWTNFRTYLLKACCYWGGGYILNDFSEEETKHLHAPKNHGVSTCTSLQTFM